MCLLCTQLMMVESHITCSRALVDACSSQSQHISTQCRLENQCIVVNARQKMLLSMMCQALMYLLLIHFRLVLNYTDAEYGVNGHIIREE